MTEKIAKPYGLWPSPLQPAALAQSLRLSDVGWDSDGETLVWLEGRSDQGVLVCQRPGEAPRDLTSTLSVRARVGYGGGDFSADRGNVVLVAQEGRLYRLPLAAGQAEPIVPQLGHMAAPARSPDGRWIVYVHTYEEVDGLAIVDAAGEHWPQKLVYGEDFYMFPAWHPAGTHLAWVSWNHPNMPWDSTLLKLGHVDATGPGLPRVDEVETLIDKADVSVLQPEFSPDGRSLAYLSDESGCSNLYLYDLASGTHRQLTSGAYEIGGPAWAQGRRAYGFHPDGQRIYYLRNEAGFERLWVYDLQAQEAHAVDAPLARYDELSQIAVAPRTGRLAFVASSSTVSPRVISYAPGDAAPIQIHRRSTSESLMPADLSQPQPVSWPTADGTTVLTFETALPYDDKGTSSIGIFKKPLYYFLSDGDENDFHRSFVGYVPEGNVPMDHINKMLDWGKILLT